MLTTSAGTTAWSSFEKPSKASWRSLPDVQDSRQAIEGGHFVLLCLHLFLLDSMLYPAADVADGVSCQFLILKSVGPSVFLLARGPR